MLRLERILALKALGLPLTQISQLTRDGSKAPDLLGRQRALLEERRRRIERALAAIDAIAKDAEPSGAIDRFVSESAWDRWETRLQGQASPVPRAPDRASPSRVDLFQKIHAALERDPRGRKAGPLLNEWDALLEREAGGYAGHADSKRQRWAGRRNWPAGMRQYVASLFDMTPEAWERVVAFIEKRSMTS
jgi:DNA-binding transcriptional MerR regulator